MAIWMNKLLDYIKSLESISSPGILVNQTTRGTSYRVHAQPITASPGSKVKQFVLKEVKGDWLNCLPYETGLAIPVEDPENPVPFTKIMKPPELQKTLFHGKTIEGWLYDMLDVATTPGETPDDDIIMEGIRRHATNGLKKEIQQVVPHYRLDWLVYAVNSVDGLTGAVEWVDLNVDGRAFSKTLIRIEEDGTFGAPE